jgi:hypothetical protein
VRQRVVLRQRGLGVVLVQRQHDVALAFVAVLLPEVLAEAADVVVTVRAPVRALETTRRVWRPMKWRRSLDGKSAT